MESFAGFELSDETHMGLDAAGYKTPTAIQAKAIPCALEGRDILGAARTGSGKTLAFVIPILETLHKEKWANTYGLAALVITPTRELAFQIAKVFAEVGRHHKFSVGLVIGGKDLALERKIMQEYSIVICTPGRILDHMDKNHRFDVSNLKMVVLDEADRILDMSFAKDIQAIIEHLPAERQTLLFSATQTRSVKDLSRLSLVNPVTIATEELAEGLQHFYTVLNAEDKVKFLHSFIKKHPQKKVLVFVSCCKEVKYFNEILTKNDVRVVALHGGLSQPRRTEAYQVFHRKEHVVLIATDIASRGLDFPKVDWVVQLDCPDDVNQYIHRSGRTARYDKKGNAVLVLLPEEEERFVPALLSKAIPIEKMEVPDNVLHGTPMKVLLENILARDPEMKASAQRCFKSYLMHLWKSGRKKEMLSIDLGAFARSLGLYDPPRIRFLDRQKRRDAAGEPVKEKAVTGTPKNSQPVLQTPRSALHAESDDSDEDILIAKKASDRPVPAEEDLPKLEPVNNKLRHISKSALARKLANKGILSNTRIRFDDDGQPVLVEGNSAYIVGPAPHDGSAGLDLSEAKERLVEVDQEDRLAQRKRIREKHRVESKKKKALRRKPGQPLAKEDMPDDGEEEFDGVTLGGFDDAGEEGVQLRGAGDGDDCLSGVEEEEVVKMEARRKKEPKAKTKRPVEDGSDLDGEPLPKTTKDKPRKVGKMTGDGRKLKKSPGQPSRSDVQNDEDLALRLLGN